jgi:AcrR family transcriptional regulator
MQTPARILRALADRRDPNPLILTERQRRREERILLLAQHLFATEGRTRISFTNMAIALRMATSTLRWHFADLEALLAAILHRHLQAVATHLAQIPQSTPGAEQLRRAAYLEYTRTGFGGLTEAHLLFVRDRHLLPDDELEPIESLRRSIGHLLAGQNGAEALLLLDAPHIDGARIELMLAALAPPREAQSSEAASCPAPPSTTRPALEAPLSAAKIRLLSTSSATPDTGPPEPLIEPWVERRLQTIGENLARAGPF